jgi:hypothetical protein
LISANRSCRVFSFASCRCSSFRAAPSSKGTPGPTCHKHTASNRRHVNVNVSELRSGFSSNTASNRRRMVCPGHYGTHASEHSVYDG